MKRFIKNIRLVVSMFVLVLLAGCNDFLDINENPNRPTDKNISSEVLFTNAAVEVGALQANAFWSNVSMNFSSRENVTLNQWMGYWGWPGDYAIQQEETTYAITPSTSIGIWNDYYRTLFDLYQTETKSISEKDTVLSAAAMILSVKVWQDLTDMFGDIPYSQAFQTLKFPQPVYDSASDIYKSLQSKLDNAVVMLEAQERPGFSSTDVVFKGDKQSWMLFANTLKLRLLLRQSETTYAQKIPTAELNKIIQHGGLLEDGAEVNPGFAGSSGKQSPFYAVYGFTPKGDAASSTARANNYIVDIMSNDPRIYYFFKPVGASVVGTTFGLPNGNPKGSDCSAPGSGVAFSSTQNAWILPGFEVQFMKAEAIARGWLSGSLEDEVNAAIKSNFKWLYRGDDFTDDLDYYMTENDFSIFTNPSATSAQKLNFVLFEKYKANCSVDALESWCDYRKMNGSFLPEKSGDYTLLSVNAARGENKIPYRWLYPQTEITTNVNVPEKVTTITKLFWMH